MGVVRIPDQLEEQIEQHEGKYFSDKLRNWAEAYESDLVTRAEVEDLVEDKIREATRR